IHLIGNDLTDTGLAGGSSCFTHSCLPPLLLLGSCLELLLAQHGFDSGNIALGLHNFLRIVQLVGCVLHTQIKPVVFHARELLVQLLCAHCTYFTCLHHHSPSS